MKSLTAVFALLSGFATTALAQDGADKYDCSLNPNGTAPISNTRSANAFLIDPQYSSFANNATAPDGFTKSFADLNASVQDPSYLGVYTLQGYDPAACAAYCNQEEKCLSFNIYAVRTPTAHPAPECPNPPATANFRCALYKKPTYSYQVTNYGQPRGPPDANGFPFLVKIRGSNGYNRDYPTDTIVKVKEVVTATKIVYVTVVPTPSA